MQKLQSRVFSSSAHRKREMKKPFRGQLSLKGWMNGRGEKRCEVKNGERYIATHHLYNIYFKLQDKKKYFF